MTQTGTKVSDSEVSYSSSSESDSESESDSSAEDEASIKRGELSGNVLLVVTLVSIGNFCKIAATCRCIIY